MINLQHTEAPLGWRETNGSHVLPLGACPFQLSPSNWTTCVPRRLKGHHGSKSRSIGSTDIVLEVDGKCQPPKLSASSLIIPPVRADEGGREKERERDERVVCQTACFSLCELLPETRFNQSWDFLTGSRLVAGREV